MDVFLTVRRKKATLFLSAKENQLVLELKKMIEGILKISPGDQLLLRQSTELDDHKTLAYYSLNSQTARAHSPATLGLCLRDPETAKFETLDVTVYSKPPDLPEMMRCQENTPSQPTAEVTTQSKP